jgi:hypothetical protein
MQYSPCIRYRLSRECIVGFFYTDAKHVEHIRVSISHSIMQEIIPCKLFPSLPRSIENQAHDQESFSSKALNWTRRHHVSSTKQVTGRTVSSRYVSPQQLLAVFARSSSTYLEGASNNSQQCKGPLQPSEMQKHQEREPTTQMTQCLHVSTLHLCQERFQK